MEFLSQIPGVPAITVLCYLAGALYKAFAPEALRKHIPVLCGMVGLLLGIGSYFLLPGTFPADSPLVAAAIGAVSGLAATGVDQSIKQEKG